MSVAYSILLILAIGAAGFYCVNKVGSFLEEDVQNINTKNKTNVIHLGFDAPYLAEDFISRLEKYDKSRHSMEVIVYSGTKNDIMCMLLSGELDYMILTNAVKELDTKTVTRKELLLTPRDLITSTAGHHIETATNGSIKVDVFWIPRWINKDKEYVSEMIMKLNKSQGALLSQIEKKKMRLETLLRQNIS